MTNDTLLFAAAQLKKHCKQTVCKDCMFSQHFPGEELLECRIGVPQYWDIDDITGERK